MCSLFYYATRNYRVYERLTSEIRSTFTSVDEIETGPKLASCQYLRACIDESLRISPSVPADLPRQVLPGGLEIDGQYFPEGTEIGSSLWALMHAEEICK